MTQVSPGGATPFHRADPTIGVQRTTSEPAGRQAGVEQPGRSTDRVEVSGKAMDRFLARLEDPTPVRQDLVDSVRAKLERGGYPDEAHIDATVEVLLNSLDLRA